MEKTICDKCFGPIVEENGKFLCAVCGEVFGKKVMGNVMDYSDFFKTLSLDDFRKISNRLKNTIIAHNKNCFVALGSNGRIYHGKDSSVPNCFGAEQIVGRGDIIGQVAITSNGELQPDTIEIADLFQRIKENGITTLRVKQLLKLNYNHKSDLRESGLGIVSYEDAFLGIGTDGKVIIYNPFKIFNYDKNDQKDVKKCGEFVKALKNFPPLKSLYEFVIGTFGVTEEGKVVCAFPFEEDVRKVAVAEKMKMWEEIESLHECYSAPFYYLIGLKRDGSLVSINEDRPHYDGIDLTVDREIVQIAPNGLEHISILYRNGDFVVVRTEDNCGELVAKNVVAIADNCYVGVDGSLYFESESSVYEYEQAPDVKLFDNIETLHKEWETMFLSCQKERENVEELHKNCTHELNLLRAEEKKLQEQKKQLGFFRFKERSELEQKLLELGKEIESKECEFELLSSKLVLVFAKPLYHHDSGFSRSIITSADLQSIRNSITNSFDSQKKDKSVVGSAVVGGLVAGPAGAVVGAIYAADKNNKNKK